jgi:hypothetical protein
MKTQQMKTQQMKAQQMKAQYMKQTSKSLANSAKLAVLASLAAVFVSQAASAAVVHVFDRSSTYSNVNMCRPLSTGETLADPNPFSPPCYPESHPGDINVEFTWADNTMLSGVWSPDAGSGIPGVSVAENGYAALIEQTGDTYSMPWTLANATSLSDIATVVLSALGSPDMGFDTDDGTNPGHGEAGFLLQMDPSSSWDGVVTVTYDWWNNWNGTTDMFHRMTLDFADQSLLVQGQDMVFYQDTDEIPLPASLALMGLGLAALARTRRRLRALEGGVKGAPCSTR